MLTASQSPCELQIHLSDLHGVFRYLRADTGIIWALRIYCRRECVPYALIVVKTVSSFVETGGEERSVIG